MEFHEYLSEVMLEMDNNPQMREGQVYFNVLYKMKPELANKITGTELDPFYQDEKLGEFLSFICKNWEK